MSSLREPEFVWTCPLHETTQKLARQDDMNRIYQDNEDQMCFSCASVRLGDYIIDDECAKQNVTSERAQFTPITSIETVSRDV